MNSRTSSPDPGSKTAGRLWILAAVLMWSSCGLFVKCGLFDDWPAATRGPILAFWRAAFAAAILLPMIRRPRWHRLLVPMTGVFAVMSVTYLAAMSLTTAANAIWLQGTAPWWVFIISVVLLRKPVVRRDLVPLCFGAVGVGMILFFEVQGENVAGVLLGLISGVTFGCVIMFLRRLHREDSAWLIGLNHSVVALALVPLVLYLGIRPTALQLLVLAGFGAFQMAIPYVFMVRGLRTVGPQEAVAIGLLEPVLNPLWLFLLGLETPRWWTVAGAALIFAGLVLRYVVLERVWSRR